MTAPIVLTRRHMAKLRKNVKRPGPKPSPTLEEIKGDPRNRAYLRRIQKEFGGANH